MMRYLSLLLMITFMAACTPAVPASPIVPVPSGDVSITTPQTGAILYNPIFYVAGTATNLPAAGFILRAISTDEQVIGEMTVQPEGDSWAVELEHTRPEEPTEITLFALPVGNVAGDYDVISVVLSSEDQRPEGVFGTILTPFEGDEVGGDIIPVFGTASGLFEGTLIVALEQPDGTLIQEQVITVNNPGIIDEVPWSTEIPTNGYEGEAVIRAYYQDANTGNDVTLANVSVLVVFAAG